MIKIKIEKFWKGGEKKVRLVNFKGLTMRGLPIEYLATEPGKKQEAFVFFELGCGWPLMLVRPAEEDAEKWKVAFHEHDDHDTDFCVRTFNLNRELTVRQWDLLRETITKAGKRLKKINEKIRGEWSGTKVYKW